MATPSNKHQKSIEFDEVNIFSIDKAVYDWFNTKRATNIQGRRVPVLFGGWERFAQMQDNKQDDNLNRMRDPSGMLILPLISIRRGDVTYNTERFVFQQADGAPRIKISERVAMSNFDANRRVPFDGPHIYSADRRRSDAPVMEIATVPYPDFVTIPYTITFWASYVRHANYFNDKIWQNAYPTDLTYKGYYFYAFIDSGTNENNEENYTDEERIIRSSFTMTVDGYLLKKNDVNVTRTASKMIMSEGYVEQPAMPTPGHKSIDEILTHERAKAPHQYPEPMPPGLGKVNYESLNNSDFGLNQYNQPQQARIGGGKIDYGAPGAQSLDSY
jgi:hypothetical protein